MDKKTTKKRTPQQVRGDSMYNISIFRFHSRPLAPACFKLGMTAVGRLPRWWKRFDGFTLIEVLVVLFIISIVTGVALLSFSHNEEQQMQTFANELTQMLNLAQDRAMLQTEVLGFSMDDREFYFVSLDLDSAKDKKKKSKPIWNILPDYALSKRRVPKNIDVILQVANDSHHHQANKNSNEDEDENEEANHHDPQVLIFSNRDLTPFTIFIGKKGGKSHYAIIGQEDGTISTKAFT